MKIEKCSAWIVSSKDRGRKKIYRGKETGNRRVYLKDGDKFEIELYNPTSDTYMAKIELDGKSISNSGILIKPGQRLYLERFIDVNKSFIFETYDIEDTKINHEATSSNGKVVVSFYQERMDKDYVYSTSYVDNLNPHYFQYSTPFYNTGKAIASSLEVNSTVNYKSTTTSSIETGQISKGNETNQKLRYVDIDFNPYPSYSETYYILPESRKLKTKSDYDRINVELEDLSGYHKRVTKKDIRSESDKVDELYNSLDKLGNLFDRQLITREEFNDRKKVIMRETK